MPIHSIPGLSEDYEVRGDRKGNRFVLIMPDWDCLHKIKEFDHCPSLEETNEAIKEYENK